MDAWKERRCKRALERRLKYEYSARKPGYVSTDAWERGRAAARTEVDNLQRKLRIA